MSGRTEPGATVCAAGVGGQVARTRTGRDGRYRLPLRVREGSNVVRLAIRDDAGITVRTIRRIVRDTRAPRLTLFAPDGPSTFRVHAHADARRDAYPLIPDRQGPAALPDADRRPARRRQAGRSGVDAARLTVGRRAGHDPRGTRQSAGHTLDRTSRAAIGIHGAYAEGSIGTAASHGCIRMRIADVEELFRQVRVGTPIRIHA